MKGVGPTRSSALQAELGLFTLGDLLEYFPFRYNDRSQIVRIRDIQSDSTAIQIEGKITAIREIGTGKAKRVTALLTDETGEMELVWFKGLKYILQSVRVNSSYIVYGKPTLFKGRYNITHPEMETLEDARILQGIGLKPVYNTTAKLSAKGLNSNGIARLTKQAVEEARSYITETLPSHITEPLRLMSRSEALFQVHTPTNTQTLEAARRRLKFEELLYLQLQLVRQKINQTTLEKGVIFEKVGDNFNNFYTHYLPFELTGAQKRVIKEIRADVARGYHMNRLIQGDVGSGKTIVALLAALLAIDNGYQVCLMAPTEILAQQHYATIQQLLAEMELRHHTRLLTGTTKKAARNEILQGLLTGSTQFLIGTHALIEPSVQFHQLGLCIIDEQHRFGVAQRAALWKKAEIAPHILVMTATPIPRTLAMTAYGDLEISIIDELPPGRKPIVTRWMSDSRRLEVFQFMENEIKKGRQVYVVYPLIEESEALDYKDLQDGYDSITRRFPLPQYRVSIVHGQMKSDVRDYEMEQFVRGNTQIMVATTVIEVGVNVPNASIMIIESAERFGLSQLHQLRGRVGRGSDQSYCILMSGIKVSSDSKTRLETMVRTQDGFEIAEVDLRLRGPGDISGTQQSGALNLKIADIVKDLPILNAAREKALEILEEDPHLEMEKNNKIAQRLAALQRKKTDWTGIS